MEKTFYSDENGGLENSSSNDDDDTNNNSNDESTMESNNDSTNILDVKSSRGSVDDDVHENSTKGQKLRPSLHSFKILSECPITMVTLYSSYKQLTTTSLPEFAPYIITLLSI